MYKKVYIGMYLLPLTTIKKKNPVPSLNLFKNSGFAEAPQFQKELLYNFIFKNKAKMNARI